MEFIILYVKGSYTESETSYGNFQSDGYEFIPNIFIKYKLTTDTERFEIEHKCAFVNTIKTRLIPIQENSPLTKWKGEKDNKNKEIPSIMPNDWNK